MPTQTDYVEAIRQVKRGGTGKVLILGRPGSGKTVYLRQLYKLDDEVLSPWEFRNWHSKFLEYLSSRGDDRLQKNTDPSENRWVTLDVTALRRPDVEDDPVAKNFEVQLTTWDVSGESLRYIAFPVEMEKEGIPEPVRKAAESLARDLVRCSAVLWFVSCSDVVPPAHPDYQKSVGLEKLVFHLAQKLPTEGHKVKVPVVVVLSCADIVIDDRSTDIAASIRDCLRNPSRSIADVSRAGEAYLRAGRQPLWEVFKKNCSEVDFIPVSAWGGPGITAVDGTIEPADSQPQGIEKPIIAVCDSLLKRFRAEVEKQACMVETKRVLEEIEAKKAAQAEKKRLELEEIESDRKKKEMAEARDADKLFRTIKLSLCGGVVAGVITEAIFRFGR